MMNAILRFLLRFCRIESRSLTLADAVPLPLQRSNSAEDWYNYFIEVTGRYPSKSVDHEWVRNYFRIAITHAYAVGYSEKASQDWEEMMRKRRDAEEVEVG